MSEVAQKTSKKNECEEDFRRASSILQPGDLIPSSDDGSAIYVEEATQGGYFIRIGEKPSEEIRADGKKYIGYGKPVIVAWSVAHKTRMKTSMGGLIVFVDKVPDVGDKVRIISVSKYTAHGVITA